ncbi:MAG: hypothetical protein AAF743_16435 [Planctomycetota bacterium]
MIADPEVGMLSLVAVEHQREWIETLQNRAKKLIRLDNELMGPPSCENSERAHAIQRLWRQLELTLAWLHEHHEDCFNQDLRELHADARLRAKWPINKVIEEVRGIHAGTIDTYSREEVRRELGLPI